MSCETRLRKIILKKELLLAVTAALATLSSQPAVAADVPQSFTLDGQLFSDANASSPLLDGSIGFTIQILDEAKVCVIYEETQSVSTIAAQGYFSAQVGTALGSSKRTSNDSANSMATIFQNIAPINGRLVVDGNPCSVAAGAGKRRFVRIMIAPSTMNATLRTLSPDLTIDSVPNAIVAERAETLQGLRSTDVLRVNTAAGSALSQTNLESLFTSTTRFNSLTSVIDGTSTNYMRSNSGSGAQLPVLPGAPTAPPIGAIWYDTSDSRVKFQTSVGPTTIGTSTGTVTSVGFTAPSELTVTGAPVTTAGTIAVTWAAQTTGKVFASPDGSTGTPTFRSLVAADVPFAIQNLGGTPSFQSGLNTAKGSATTAGRIWISTDTREIYRDTGTTWETIGSAGGGGAPSGAASGDLSGTYPGPTVSRIQGTGVAVTAPLDGQVLKYIGGGTAAWTPTNFNIGDLKTAAGTQQFAGSATCAASQTLTWSSLTDTFVCSNIAGLDGGAITAGTVPAARLPASASAWTVSGADLYRTGGNVGIGTATPLFNLDVDTNVATYAARIKNSHISAGSLYVEGASTPATLVVNDKSGSRPLLLQNDGTEILRVTGAGRIQSLSTSSAGSPSYSFLSDPDTGMFRPASTTLGFTTGSTERMRISSTGNVGIGTASPQSRLHIQNASGSSGSASFTTADFSPGVSGSSLNLSSGATSGNTYYQMQTMIAGAAAFGNLILQPNAGNVGVGTASPSTTLDINGGMTYRGLATGSAPATAASQGKIYFDSTLNKFRVSENNGAYTDLVGGGGGGAATSVNAGNGTASAPSISFSGDTDTGFFSNGADTIGVSTGNSNIFNFSSAGLVSTTTGGGLVTSANGTAAAPAFSFAGDTGTGWFRAAASTLAASTGGTERMRIDSSGNVGIGTTSPGGRLELSSATTTGTDIRLTNTDTGGRTYGLLSSGTGSTGGAGKLHIYDYNTPRSMMIFDSSGNVEIEGTLTSDGAVGGFGVGDRSNANTTILYRTGNKTRLYDNTFGDQFTLDNSTGNLGIATTSPAAKIHAYSTSGSAALFGASTTFLDAANHDVEIVGSGSRTPLTVVGGSGVIEFWKDTAASKAIAFGMSRPGTSLHDDFSISAWNGSSWSENFRVVTANGNVGIGTTAPATSLDVGSKTDAIRLPAGTTAQRPATPANGDLRYNSQTAAIEGYSNSSWVNMGGSSPTVTVANTNVSGATTLTLPPAGPSLQNLTMTASATISFPVGGYIGQTMMVTICQDSTGGFTPTFAGSGTTLRATYPAGWPTTTADKCDVCGWVYYSTGNWMLTGCNLNQ